MGVYFKLSVILLSFVVACDVSTGPGRTSKGEPVTVKITETYVSGLPPGLLYKTGSSVTYKMAVLFYNARGVKCVASGKGIFIDNVQHLYELPVTCDDGNSGSLTLTREYVTNRWGWSHDKIDYKLMDGERDIILKPTPLDTALI